MRMLRVFSWRMIHGHARVHDHAALRSRCPALARAALWPPRDPFHYNALDVAAPVDPSGLQVDVPQRQVHDRGACWARGRFLQPSGIEGWAGWSNPVQAIHHYVLDCAWVRYRPHVPHPYVEERGASRVGTMPFAVRRNVHKFRTAAIRNVADSDVFKIDAVHNAAFLAVRLDLDGLWREFKMGADSSILHVSA